MHLLTTDPTPKQPPPHRQGVGPSSVVTPAGPWGSVLDFLSERFAGVPRTEWEQRLAQGEVFNAHAQPLALHTPFQAHCRIYYYRGVRSEPHNPAQATVLYCDADLLVADKPHFLPVLPSGNYLQETLLVRLKNELGIDTLSPIHRIDRDTAGLVLFSVNPATRGAYQALFRERAVLKTYLAVAPYNPVLHWPQVRSSRIAPAAHFMQQTEVAGAPNAHTHIELLAAREPWALYALRPHTGQRHQLRVHMAALGLPLRNDGIYPALTPTGACDTAHPLQLLAHSISLIDPLSQQRRHFVSQQRLQEWPEPSRE